MFSVIESQRERHTDNVREARLHGWVGVCVGGGGGTM